MDASGVVTTVTNQVDPASGNDSAPRIFVLHRPALLGEQAVVAVKGLRKAGYLTVTEFDDHPEHFRMMQMGGDLSFRGVHAVQTSTAAMAMASRPVAPSRYGSTGINAPEAKKQKLDRAADQALPTASCGSTPAASGESASST